MVDKQFIENNKEYPIVYMGDAVSDFFKAYEGPVVQVSNDAELREQLSYYSSISNLGRDLVISDISFVTGANSILLKFLEETPLNVVLLSRYDKLNPVISSRIKKIVKYYRTKTDSRFMSPGKGASLIEEQLSPDSSYFDKVRYQGKYSPKLMMLDRVCKSKRIKQRLMQIL